MMPGFKVSKDRLSLMLYCDASEDFKLKPLLVYRAENPRALMNIRESCLPVNLEAYQKSLGDT